MKTDFSDSPQWDDLARKHLSSYNLPKWDKPCTVEGMRRWLDRLNISESLYKKQTNTELKEFIELNPDWPLRAFIGLCLEMK